MLHLLHDLMSIYLYGAATIALLFLIAYALSPRWARREFPEVFRLVREMAPEYILLWPWRVVGFPVLCYIRVRRGTLRWPD